MSTRRCKPRDIRLGEQINLDGQWRTVAQTTREGSGFYARYTLRLLSVDNSRLEGSTNCHANTLWRVR